MQPLATIPVTLTDVNASSELGARVETAQVAPWPLSQGGSGAGLGIGLLLGGLALGAIAVILYLNQEPTIALGFGAAALPLLLTGIGGLNKRGDLKGTLTIYERGFTLQQGKRSVSAQWPDVQTAALKEKEWLTNGTSNGVCRELKLQVAGRALVIPCAFKTGGDDAFGRATGALFDALADLTMERLRGGGGLTGAGWSLTQAGLKLPNGTTHALQQVTGAGIWENRARIWVEGKDDPVLDLPADSSNARTLLIVAAREMPDRSGQAAPTTGFGRRLFAKKAGAYQLGVVFAVLAVIFAVPGFAVPLGSGDAAGWGILAVSVVMGFIARKAMKARVYIYERGVKYDGFFGARALPFSEVAVFNYGALRQYYNGAYTGTTHSLSLIPAEKGKKPITFSLTSRGTDDDIEKFRDGVAAIVADRLYDVVAAGGRVPWEKAVLTRDGVCYRPTKLLGGKQPEQVLPFNVVAHSFNQGVMFLFGEDRKKHVSSLQCNGHNFYPGLQLYFRLAGEATRGERGGVVA